jgi:hypothetical protein
MRISRNDADLEEDFSSSSSSSAATATASLLAFNRCRCFLVVLPRLLFTGILLSTFVAPFLPGTPEGVVVVSLARITEVVLIG